MPVVHNKQHGNLYIRDIKGEADKLGIDSEGIDKNELRRIVDDRKARDYFGKIVGLKEDSSWFNIINEELKFFAENGRWAHHS